MGKAGRRKKNRQKRREKLNGDPIHGTAAGDSNSASPNTIANPQSAVLRLRHADPKVRHAALVALQASVLSQLHCASHKPVSMKVLQAVREQVTSNDLECSAVAAECLAQYLAATSTRTANSSANNNKNKDQQKQTIASWALILLGRLEDCRKALEEQRQSSNAKRSANQRKKAEKIKKQWYAVAAPCFVALCHLIEDNGHALDQINLQKKTFVQVVFGMLSLECESKTPSSAEGAASSNDVAMNDAETDEVGASPHDAIFAKLRDTTALYSARCLHSALDDNWELAEVLDCGGQQEQNQQLWKNLLGGNNEASGGHFLSSMTRLHLIGCLVNLYQLSLYGGNQTDSLAWYERAILETGIQASSPNGSSDDGLLLEVLLSGTSSDGAGTSLLQMRLAENEAKYRAAEALLAKQQRDQILEDEIDAQVKERKEPAKLIARRQKKVKEAKREAFREQQKAKMIAQAEAAASKDDADMEDASENEDEEDVKEESTTGKITREQDGEEAKSEAMLEWNSTTGPIQLGLEIFTNLVSTWIAAPDGDNDEDDPMGGFGGSKTPRSSELFRTIQGQSMDSRLTQTLQTLSNCLRTCQAPTSTLDDPIRRDAEETIEKVSACVTNCFLSGIILDPSRVVWEATLSDLRTELGRASPSEATLDAGSSILAVAVEMNPGILRPSSGGTNHSGDQFALFQSLLPRADAVRLLSSVVLLETAQAATTTAESEATIRALTENFLSLLRPAAAPQAVHSVKTQTSILKAFMDWYGNDDFYPHLYENLKVSEVIKIALEFIAKNQTNMDLDEEQLQILHNSDRFIDYKKQLKAQLQAR